MKLHEYQKVARDYLIEHAVAALFLAPGLGKTIITLVALELLMYDYFSVRKCLVVAPPRVAQTVWAQEAEKWGLHLRVSRVIGTPQQRMAALYREADVYVISRSCLSWLKEKWHGEFDCVVFDELSSFKDHTSDRSKAARYFGSKARRRIGLTASPAGNGLMDLFSEMLCLDGGKRLGRFVGRFREEFFLPDKRNGMQVWSWKLREGADGELYRRIGDCTISMASKDYLDMPDLVEIPVAVTLEGKALGAYKALKKTMVAEIGGEEITALSAGALCDKLRQMAGGAVYTQTGIEHSEAACAPQGWTEVHDLKLQALEDIIEAAYGAPVLVAYWYRHELERLRERFGAVPLKTEADISRWNAGGIPVAAIHPASAGHGLNLQDGGSLLVWYTLPWSWELYEQTTGRLWRQGQRADTVRAYHLLTEGTIDGQVLAAIRVKDTTQAALLAAVKAEIEHG